MDLNIEPFTYYKNDASQRVFLIVGIWEPTDTKPGYVDYIEWGKTREQYGQILLVEFQKQISLGKLVLFTPKYPKNEVV